MRTGNEDTWEAEYWDEYIQEFGVAAYIQVRYWEAIQARKEA